MSKPTATATNNDETEAQLLAALGSTAASASAYEESVLRDATLRSAPQITLPHSTIASNIVNNPLHSSSSSLVRCGDERPALPDLSALAPSTASSSSASRKSKKGMLMNSADVPHVLKVLSRTQDMLQSTLNRSKNTTTTTTTNFNGGGDEEKRQRDNIDLLRMKEQILLGYLTDVAGQDDDSIIPQRPNNVVATAASNSNGRKRRRSSNVGDNYYGKAASDNDNIVDEGGLLITKKTLSKKKKSSKRTTTDQSMLQQQLPTSTNRLDRIKNGEQVLVDYYSSSSTAITKQKPKRNTMMQMKSQMRIDSGLAPIKSMEEERFDAQKSRNRREERRKRRLKRQRAALGIVDDGEEEVEFSNDNDNDDDGRDTKKKGAKKERIGKAATNNITGILRMKGISRLDSTDGGDDGVMEEKKEDEEATKSSSSGVRWASEATKGTDDENETIATNHQVEETKKKRTHTKVFCPICQVILTVEGDAVAEGADGGGGGISPDEFLAKHVAECQAASRTRNGGRTLRKRQKPAYVDNTADDCDNGSDDVDEKEVEAFAPNETDVVEDGDDDEEELQSDYKEPIASSNEREPPKSIDDMDEFDYEDRVDDWVEHGLQRMGTMTERDSTEIPPGAVVYEGGLEVPAWINDRLFPYQRTGARWMWELHCQGAGGVVGDEMGLGKTVQVSSYLGAMAANRLLDSVLIIAPATMLAHWLSELAIWAPGLRRIMIHRSGESDGISRVISRGMLRSLQKWLRNARRDRVNEAIDEDDYNDSKEHAFPGTGYALVTTYESIRRSDEWTNHPWSYVVMDEGQKIRNPDADVTLACKRLRTPHRLLLSGTPIQNDLRELWSLFDFVFPGRLGTLPAFEAEFADPIKRGGYSNASPMVVQLAYRCALVLRDLINPYMLRRQKKDVKEVNRMPGKTEQVLFCRLSSKQRSLYEEYLRSDEVMGVMRGAVQLLKAVTVLRKICNHPDLVTGPNGDSILGDDDECSSSEDEDFYDKEKLADRSGKLQVLSKILPLWHKQGHKVLIFSQWRKTLTIIENFANQNQWKYCRLDGNTGIAARQKLVDKFNNDESYFCMLMTTRTGGVGLNITGANRVLLYDPDWNPQTDAQARERAWRFGQKREVTVYRLITAGTIEEKIYQRQIFKTALTNQILQDPKQRRLFSQKDLRDLFTLKADTSDVTETGELTKGGGVVEMPVPSAEPSDEDDTTADKKRPADNSDTLEAVMKSKGLCGIFDHDYVENPSAKKSMSVVEMEESARKVALKAALALKESSENQLRFEPTWTGSVETKQFEGANSSRVASAGGNRLASSSSLLANLQNKRMQIASSSNSTSASGSQQSDAETKKYSAMLLRIRKYFQRKADNNNSPTTREILSEFKDVSDSDSAIFKNMLKSVASVKNGRWTLRP